MIGSTVGLMGEGIIYRCEGKLCPVFLQCPHIDKRRNHPEKCRLMESYMGIVGDLMNELFKDSISNAQVYRISSELMPLYRQLFMMKVVEMGFRMKKDGCFYRNPGGSMVAHPVYEEIRTILRDIRAFWDESGLMGLPEYNPGMDLRLYINARERSKPQVDINLGAILHKRRDKLVAVAQAMDELLMGIAKESLDEAFEELPEDVRDAIDPEAAARSAIEAVEKRIYEEENPEPEPETPRDFAMDGDPDLHDRLMGFGKWSEAEGE